MKNQQIHQSFIHFITYGIVDGRVMSSDDILSTAPQFSISQKALGTLPEDGNVMPKHVGATIHAKLNE
jgi:hypothetical protein